MRPTLFARVFVLYLIIAGAGLLVVWAGSTIALNRYESNRSIEDVRTITEIAATVVASGSGDWDDFKSAVDLIDAVARVAGADLELSLVDRSGDSITILRSVSAAIRTAIEFADGTGTSSGTIRVDGAGRHAYAVASVGLTDPNNQSRGLQIVGTRPLRVLGKGARRVLIVFVALTVVLIIAFAILFRGYVHWIAEPLRSLASTARSYSEGVLEVHRLPDGPEELAEAVQSLNTMARNLGERLAAISDQRNQLESILSSMVEGVLVLDQSRRIIRMNDAAGRLMGASPIEAEGKTLIGYLRNAQLDEIAESAWGADQPIERTVTLYRDQPLHLQVHASALTGAPSSTPSGVLVVMNDITRLKHLEDLRKDFVANVSHELKTPITSIKGFVETLLDGAAEDPENTRRFLNIILNHTDRLHAIIEDLLSLSRLEQADQRITFYDFPIRVAVESAIEFCAPRAQDKSIDIALDIQGQETGWGNPNLIEQALVNLIDNAVKYSPDGSRVEVASNCEDGALTMRVIDHGQGIPARDLPRIFERFYRTDRARSRELGGTGLGLAIVKHIAMAHYGEVTVQSLLGEGSTFTMEIPQKHGTDAAEPGSNTGLAWDALS